jgi:hypothetical protein
MPEKALVYEIRMVPVHRIFDLQFPVAAKAVLMNPAARVDLAYRR